MHNSKLVLSLYPPETFLLVLIITNEHSFLSKGNISLSKNFSLCMYAINEMKMLAKSTYLIKSLSDVFKIPKDEHLRILTDHPSHPVLPGIMKNKEAQVFLNTVLSFHLIFGFSLFHLNCRKKVVNVSI